MTLRIGVLAQAPGGPLTSSAWIRLLLPLQRLEQQGGCSLQLLELHDEVATLDLAGLDRLVVQRAACPSLADAEALVQRCHSQALPLIFDLDDALFALPSEHPERERYAQAIPALDHLLAAADLRVFSTRALADQCCQRLQAQGAVPRPQAVLANGLDAGLWAGKERYPRAQADGPLKLLYVGSRTHDADLALILPQLDALAAHDPQAFRLTLIGVLSQPLQRPWLDVVAVPRATRRHPRYPRFVRWLRRLPRHDLGLAPLVADPFTAAKSDVKVLDYAALGLPALCSPGPAYQGLLDAGLALAAAPDQWAAQIIWASRHRRQLRRIAQAAHAFLWQFRSSHQLADGWAELLR